ncbi:hypothetical protein N9E76_00510, partial [bacterium]|nr:hypothetical protein [bacterium]
MSVTTFEVYNDQSDKGKDAGWYFYEKFQGIQDDDIDSCYQSLRQTLKTNKGKNSLYALAANPDVLPRAASILYEKFMRRQDVMRKGNDTYLHWIQNRKPESLQLKWDNSKAVYPKQIIAGDPSELTFWNHYVQDNFFHENISKDTQQMLSDYIKPFVKMHAAKKDMKQQALWPVDVDAATDAFMTMHVEFWIALLEKITYADKTEAERKEFEAKSNEDKKEILQPNKTKLKRLIQHILSQCTFNAAVYHENTEHDYTKLLHNENCDSICTVSSLYDRYIDIDAGENEQKKNMDVLTAFRNSHVLPNSASVQHDRTNDNPLQMKKWEAILYDSISTDINDISSWSKAAEQRAFQADRLQKDNKYIINQYHEMWNKHTRSKREFDRKVDKDFAHAIPDNKSLYKEKTELVKEASGIDEQIQVTIFSDNSYAWYQQFWTDLKDSLFEKDLKTIYKLISETRFNAFEARHYLSHAILQVARRFVLPPDLPCTLAEKLAETYKACLYMTKNTTSISYFALDTYRLMPPAKSSTVYYPTHQLHTTGKINFIWKSFALMLYYKIGQIIDAANKTFRDLDQNYFQKYSVVSDDHRHFFHGEDENDADSGDGPPDLAAQERLTKNMEEELKLKDVWNQLQREVLELKAGNSTFTELDTKIDNNIQKMFESRDNQKTWNDLHEETKQLIGNYQRALLKIKQRAVPSKVSDQQLNQESKRVLDLIERCMETINGFMKNASFVSYDSEEKARLIKAFTLERAKFNPLNERYMDSSAKISANGESPDKLHKEARQIHKEVNNLNRSMSKLLDDFEALLNVISMTALRDNQYSEVEALKIQIQNLVQQMQSDWKTINAAKQAVESNQAIWRELNAFVDKDWKKLAEELQTLMKTPAATTATLNTVITALMKFKEKFSTMLAAVENFKSIKFDPMLTSASAPAAAAPPAAAAAPATAPAAAALNQLKETYTKRFNDAKPIFLNAWQNLLSIKGGTDYKDGHGKLGPEWEDFILDFGIQVKAGWNPLFQRWRSLKDMKRETIPQVQACITTVNDVAQGCKDILPMVQELKDTYARLKKNLPSDEIQAMGRAEATAAAKAAGIAAEPEGAGAG